MTIKGLLLTKLLTSHLAENRHVAIEEIARAIEDADGDKAISAGILGVSRDELNKILADHFDVKLLAALGQRKDDA